MRIAIPMDEKYPCFRCSACCRKIGKMVVSCIATLDQADKDTEIHPIIEEIACFPYDINIDGSCSRLDGTNCTVYDTRPRICNIDRMYNDYWKDIMSKEEWYEKSLQSCKNLRET